MSEKENALALKRRDLVMGGVFLCAAVIFYAFTFQFTGYDFETVDYDMGPRFMPRLMLGALIIESLLLIIFAAKKKLATDLKNETIQPIFQRRPFIMLGVFLLYIYLSTLFGYIPSSIVFMIVGFLLLGVRNIWALVLISPIVTIATYFLFSSLLNIYLPAGSLF